MTNARVENKIITIPTDRFAAIEQRLASVDRKLTKFDGRLTDLEKKSQEAEVNLAFVSTMRKLILYQDEKLKTIERHINSIQTHPKNTQMDHSNCEDALQWSPSAASGMLFEYSFN